MRTLMGRLMGGAHDRGADEAGTHEVSRPRASWPSRLFRPEGAPYRSPGQRPGSRGPSTPFPEPCRGDLGFRAANMGLDVSIVVRPFRALWFAWRPVPRALPWARRWAAPLVLRMGMLMGTVRMGTLMGMALMIGALLRLGLMTRRPGGRAFRRGRRPAPNRGPAPNEWAEQSGRRPATRRPL